MLFHIDDDIYNNGRIDLNGLQPIGRVAGNSYIKTTLTFDIERNIKPDKVK